MMGDESGTQGICIHDNEAKISQAELSRGPARKLRKRHKITRNYMYIRANRAAEESIVGESVELKRGVEQHLI